MVYIIFFIGIVSAYLGSFSSGGAGSISIALMVLLGLPPQMAGITFKLGKIGDRIGGIYLFHKHGKIPKRFVFGGALAVMIGSFFGSFFISRMPDGLMYLVSGLSMLFLVIISLRKHRGGGVLIVSRVREYLGYGLYAILSVIGNLFPAGSGVWYYFVNTMVFGLSPIESKGIASFVSIFWFIGTLSGVLLSGVYNIVFALSLGIGMIIGGYFGTKHMIHIGDEIMRKVLLVSIFIFAWYFLYLAYYSFL